MLQAGFVGGAILVVAILFFTSRGQKENDANFKKAVDDSSLFPAKTADAGYRPIVRTHMSIHMSIDTSMHLAFIYLTHTLQV